MATVLERHDIQFEARPKEALDSIPLSSQFIMLLDTHWPVFLIGSHGLFSFFLSFVSLKKSEFRDEWNALCFIDDELTKPQGPQEEREDYRIVPYNLPKEELLRMQVCSPILSISNSPTSFNFGSHQISSYESKGLLL